MLMSSETRDMMSRGSNSSNNFLLSSNPTSFKHAEGEFLKSRDFMGSDFFTGSVQQQSSQSGLARYRSAPSSFFATLLDSTTPDNSSSGDDESEAMLLSAFMDGPSRDLKQEAGVETEARPGALYEAAVNVGGGAVVGSYSVGMESHVQMRLNSGNNGNHHGSNSLVRQSSSPAGFLNGFNVMGEVGNYRLQNHTEGSSSASGLSNHISFSSAPSSNLRFMPSIPEGGNENVGSRSPENIRSRNGNPSNSRDYEASGFPNNSWNESSFSSLKRNRDGDLKIFSDFSVMENQETRKNSSGLVHHLSLPKTSSEMAAAEKFLQFQQDAVPCQIRAKRGCATHPRSIAERMRRNRISDKMKKLQDLFPNLDKQTNTADMLDLAVEYIKDLQKQVQTLTDTRAKCVCPNKEQQTSPTS